MKFLNSKKNSKTAKRAEIRKKAMRRVRFFSKNPYARKKQDVKKSKIFVRKYMHILKKLIVITVLGILLGYGLDILIKSDFFQITEVHINGATTFVSTEDLRSIAEKNVSKKNIFLVRSSELEQILQKNFLGAKNIQITKKFPREILIQVVERKPIAIIYNNESEKKYLVDEDGYVLGIVDEEKVSFPKIRYDEKIFVGSFINVNIVPLSTEILDTALELKLNVSSMSFSPKSVEVSVNQKTMAYLSLKKSINESMNVIASLIKQSSLEGKNIKIIDLRYDKVVVSYE